MTDADRWHFVIAAYAIAAVMIVGMIVAVVADYRAQSRALRRFDAARGRPPEP